MPTPSAAFNAWREAGRYWPFQGHRVFYRADGDLAGGKVLFCLHGFPTASWDWHELWPALLARFDAVIAPDFLGFGWSDKPADHDYRVMEQADLCEGLLQALGVRRVHLLAHDFGNTVAQELLARHEDRVALKNDSLVISSCVFLNGGLFPEVHRARPLQKLLLTPLGPLLSRLTNEARFGRSLNAVFGPGTQLSLEQIHEFWCLIDHQQGRLRMPALLRYIPERRHHRARWVGVLQRTAVPLRFINGPMDPVSGAHMAARYRELVPNPDIVLLGERIGHYPQVEDPAGTLAAFLGFHKGLASLG